MEHVLRMPLLKASPQEEKFENKNKETRLEKISNIYQKYTLKGYSSSFLSINIVRNTQVLIKNYYLINFF